MKISEITLYSIVYHSLLFNLAVGMPTLTLSPQSVSHLSHRGRPDRFIELRIFQRTHQTHNFVGGRNPQLPVAGLSNGSFLCQKIAEEINSDSFQFFPPSRSSVLILRHFLPIPHRIYLLWGISDITTALALRHNSNKTSSCHLHFGL